MVRVADQLVAAGRSFYERGWVMGTSGNLSAVVSRDPLRLAITPSGAHKGRLAVADLLEVDADGVVATGSGKPSAETLLHLEIARARGAGAILHTHSVWSTILSDRHKATGGFALEGYEMLKGLEGVTTHEHREWVPILTNDQNISRLAGVLHDTLGANPGAHAVLLGAHGMYTWGRDVTEAERHVEILEFLFEVAGRTAGHDR